MIHLLAQIMTNANAAASTETLSQVFDRTADAAALVAESTWFQFLENVVSVLNSEISFGDSRVSILGLITLFLMLIPAFILSRTIQKILASKVFPRIPSLSDSNKFVLMKVIHYVIMVVTFLIILSTIGINLSSLTVLFGLLSVGIGFGLQNLAANFISGIIILIEQPIKVGEWVEVNNREGEVLDINLRATHIETNDAVHIIIPNQEILANNIVNNSQGRPYYRVHTPIGVSYSADMKLVHDVLLEVAQENEKTLHLPKPEVWMVGHGDSSVNWEILTWIKTPKDRVRMQSQVYLAAWWALKENNIEIPFPQRDLHLRSSDIPGLGGVASPPHGSG